jgi:phosphatidylinositol kinase/protein kinase (PI-3  family)
LKSGLKKLITDVVKNQSDD